MKRGKKNKGQAVNKDMKTTSKPNVNMLENKNQNNETREEKSLTPLSEPGTTAIEMWKQESKTLVDKPENLTESYEPALNFFQKEILESTSVLNESVQLLHSQTKSLLKSPESEERRLDIWNVEQARLNMNSIAKLIQTKINFIRVLKG